MDITQLDAFVPFKEFFERMNILKLEALLAIYYSEGMLGADQRPAVGPTLLERWLLFRVRGTGDWGYGTILHRAAAEQALERR